jgi:hypothetical protein
MRGIDGLKGNSPLGVEPKGEGVSGDTGYKISGQKEQTPAPSKFDERKSKTTDSATQTTTSGGAVGSVRNTNPALPVAKAVVLDSDPSSLKPW